MKHVNTHDTLNKINELLLESVTENEFHHVNAGESLWRQGTNADSLFILQAGWACSARYRQDGHRQLLEVFLPGDVLGLCRFPLRERHTDALMLTEGWVSELPYARLLKLCTAHAAAAYFLFSLGQQRQAMLSERLNLLKHGDARKKLVHFLCECHARLLALGEVYRNGFLLPLTQQDLADTLGMSAVHVSRIFTHLAAEGLVQRNQYHLTIRDPARLKRMVAFDERYLRIANQMEDEDFMGRHPTAAKSRPVE